MNDVIFVKVLHSQKYTDSHLVLTIQYQTVTLSDKQTIVTFCIIICFHLACHSIHSSSCPSSFIIIHHQSSAAHLLSSHLHLSTDLQYCRNLSKTSDSFGLWTLFTYHNYWLSDSCIEFKTHTTKSFRHDKESFNVSTGRAVPGLHQASFWTLEQGRNWRWSVRQSTSVSW